MAKAQRPKKVNRRDGTGTISARTVFHKDGTQKTTRLTAHDPGPFPFPGDFFGTRTGRATSGILPPMQRISASNYLVQAQSAERAHVRVIEALREAGLEVTEHTGADATVVVPEGVDYTEIEKRIMAAMLGDDK